MGYQQVLEELVHLPEAEVRQTNFSDSGNFWQLKARKRIEEVIGLRQKYYRIKPNLFNVEQKRPRCLLMSAVDEV